MIVFIISIFACSAPEPEELAIAGVDLYDLAQATKNATPGPLAFDARGWMAPDAAFIGEGFGRMEWEECPEGIEEFLDARAKHTWTHVPVGGGPTQHEWGRPSRLPPRHVYGLVVDEDGSCKLSVYVGE